MSIADRKEVIRTENNSEVPPAMLMAAFEKFKEASSKLEERYSALRGEAEYLRKELQKKEIEVRRAERMAVLGQTAAALAHEVRNPLGAMKLFASLLREDLKALPKSIVLVDEIERSIGALDGVVSNVLQFAKEHESNLLPININSIISDQITVFKKLDRKDGVGFVTALSGASYILGNEQLLRQIFYNLFLNAAQAMHYKGTITVSTSTIKRETEEWLAISIKDTGPGIPNHIIDNIFEPFVTGRDEGTGLGLAIVKKILDQHKAQIIVSNQDGAEFIIKFPVKV